MTFLYLTESLMSMLQGKGTWSTAGSRLMLYDFLPCWLRYEISLWTNGDGLALLRLVDTPWRDNPFGLLKSGEEGGTYVDECSFSGASHTHDNQNNWC
jgi:hypothetical protein